MRMNRPLTSQQQTVYNFIRDKIVTRGYGPTVREIGEYMNIKSPNGVMCHLRALERKGVLTRTANKSRAIELTESINRIVGATLPVVGRIASGCCILSAAAIGGNWAVAGQRLSSPTAAVEAVVPQPAPLSPGQLESIDLSLLTAPEGRYFLRVLDDSLVDAQIRSGDLVLVQRQSHAGAGQLAIVRTGEGETCLRYWLPEQGRIRLQPVMRNHPVTVVDRTEVLGVVAGVVRMLEPL